MQLVDIRDAELARGKVRIAQLEREAVEQIGDAAKALRDHLDRYESLVLAIAEVIWTRDPKGGMVGEQPSWAAYTGQTRTQYEHQGWLDAVHPNDRESDRLLWDRAVAARRPCEYEHRLRRNDGEYRYFSVRAVPLFAGDGTIREWAGIHSDITQRKMTEQSLRDGVRQFRELADAMPQIVWGARPDGHVEYYNRRWYEFTGRKEELAGDGSCVTLVHPDDQRESLERWSSAVQSGEEYEIEYRLKGAEGSYRWFLTRARPVRDTDGAITRWLGTCTDIDERKRTEEALARAKDTAESARGELEAFSYSVAHDLRAPLRGMNGFAQVLLNTYAEKLDEEGQAWLNEIVVNAARMATLIDALLALARLTKSEPVRESVDLSAIVRAIASQLAAAEPQRKVALTAEDDVHAQADPALLRAVLENLVGNAWKFTSKVPSARIEFGTTEKGLFTDLSATIGGVELS